jgi:hypothetical protein
MGEREIAIHEAGHALAWYRGGIEMEIVTIVPVEMGEWTRGGAALATPGWIARMAPVIEDGAPFEAFSDAQRSLFDACIIGRYAGPAAEARCSGRSIVDCMIAENEEDNPPESDYNTVIAVMLEISKDPDLVWRYTHEMRQRAEEMIAAPDNWHAIETLAAALLERREIDGTTAAGILAAALDGSA